MNTNWQDALASRAWLLQTLRAYFAEQQVLEVETPALSLAANTDPHIKSFQVGTRQGMRYLHTSPEYPMKRLVAAGSGDIYQVCKVWRDEEHGRRHNPEFSLLEWYRVGYSYQQLMQDVAGLLKVLFPEYVLAPHFLSYRAAFLEMLDLCPHSCPDSVLLDALQQKGIAYPADLERTEMLDLLMSCYIEPNFSDDRFTFIYDYPASQRALARLKPDNVDIAERFEVYLGATELGNGYQEETDAIENRNIFEHDLSIRQQKGLMTPPMDENFLSALTNDTMPKTSGVAIGIDRLLMCKQSSQSIADVISFPWEVA